MNLSLDKSKLLISFSKNLRDYVKKAKLLFPAKKDVSEKFEDALIEFDDKKERDMPKGETIEEMFALTALLSEMDKLIFEMMEYADDFNVSSDSSLDSFLSQTYVSNVSQDFFKLQKQFAVFQKKHTEVDIALIEKMTAKIMAILAPGSEKMGGKWYPPHIWRKMQEERRANQGRPSQNQHKKYQSKPWHKNKPDQNKDKPYRSPREHNQNRDHRNQDRYKNQNKPRDRNYDGDKRGYDRHNNRDRDRCQNRGQNWNNNQHKSDFNDLPLYQVEESKIKELVAVYEKLPVVSLYASVLQALVDLSGDTEKSALKLVEKEKRDALDMGQTKINQPFRSFGWVPKGASGTLTAITKAAGIKDTTIITIYKHTYNPAEFTPWNILKYNKDGSGSRGGWPNLHFGGEVLGGNKGIDPNYITTFSTVVKYAPAKWNVSVKITGNKKSDYISMVESIAPGLFRAMVYKGAHKVLKCEVPETVRYFESKMHPVSRSHAYNSLMLSKLTDNLFLQKQININELKNKQEIIDAKFLRNDIYIEMIRMYKKHKKMDRYKFAQIIHDPKLIDIFSASLISQYDKYNEEHTKVTSTIMSFMSQIYQLRRIFAKELHDNFVAEKIPDDAFAGDKSQEIFEKIIVKSIESILPDDSNIYQDILHKNAIVNAILAD